MNSLNLFFNHYSFLEIEEKECNILLAVLVKAIESLDSKLDFQYDFYIEVEKLLDFEVHNGRTLETVLEDLGEDLENFFLDFLTRSNKVENLFSIDEYIELLPDYDVYLDGDGSGEQYYLFSLSHSLNGYLLSLARNTWDKSLVNVGKFNKDKTSERIDLNNISKESHSNGLIETIQKQEKNLIFNQLPQDKMLYSDAFKEWFFERTKGDVAKIIAKMNFAMEHKLDRRDGCIGKIDSAEISDLYEVVVGDSNENDRAKIRVFFKDHNDITNVIYGFIKCREEGMSYQEAGHIKNTEEIIKKEKLFD